jgi:hypothetical protein
MARQIGERRSPVRSFGINWGNQDEKAWTSRDGSHKNRRFARQIQVWFGKLDTAIIDIDPVKACRRRASNCQAKQKVIDDDLVCDRAPDERRGGVIPYDPGLIH